MRKEKELKIEELTPKPEPWKAFPRETAWLRKLDANNPNDIEMYKLIDTQPEVQKQMIGEPMTDEELKELFLDEEQVFYGVYGDKNEDKMEGWVSLYEPEDELVERLIEQGLVEKGIQVLEISFARFIDSNPPSGKQVKGLMPSAIRQACLSFLEKNKNILIAAFTSPKNLPSQGTLINSGFVIKGKILYDNESTEKDNFWILDKNELEKILEKKKTKQV